MKLKEISKFNKFNINKNYKNNFIRYLDTANITEGIINEIVEYKLNEAPSRAKRIVHRNDIIYSTVRPNLKHYGIMTELEENLIVSTGFTVITCNNNINPNYIYAYLTLPYITNKLASIAEGSVSTYPSIRPQDLGNIEIILPEEKVQNKIAHIYTTYNKMIDNNIRRIFILEQMAEEIYKNFFAYHKIKSISEEIRLGDIMIFQRGISYSSEEIDCEEGINLINLKNINAYGGFRRDGTKKYDGKYKESQIVKSGDLIMGVTDMTQDRRTVGSVALKPTIEGTSVISADLVKVNSKIDNTFLYAMFKYGNLSKYISQFANGANVLHLKPQTISNIKVQLPNIELINSYVKVVKPIIDEIDKLNLQNDNLVIQRDLLLPRLMSGKLEVK